MTTAKTRRNKEGKWTKRMKNPITEDKLHSKMDIDHNQ